MTVLDRILCGSDGTSESVPGLQGAFATVPLGVAEAAVVVGLALVPFGVVESGKALVRRRAS